MADTAAGLDVHGQGRGTHKAAYVSSVMRTGDFSFRACECKRKMNAFLSRPLTLGLRLDAARRYATDVHPFIREKVLPRVVLFSLVFFSIAILDHADISREEGGWVSEKEFSRKGRRLRLWNAERDAYSGRFARRYLIPGAYTRASFL